ALYISTTSAAHRDPPSFPTRRSSDLVGGATVPAPQPAGLVIEEAGPAKNAYADRKGHSIKHATIHWWGKPSGQSFEGIRDYLIRSEEHTSELQSRENLVCRLLLEKKK